MKFDKLEAEKKIAEKWRKKNKEDVLKDTNFKHFKSDGSLKSK